MTPDNVTHTAAGWVCRACGVHLAGAPKGDALTWILLAIHKHDGCALDAGEAVAAAEAICAGGAA